MKPTTLHRAAAVALALVLAVPPIPAHAAPQRSAASVASDITRLKKQLDDAGRAYAAIQIRLDDADERIGATDRKMRKTLAALDRAESKLGIRARGIYTQSDTDILSAVFRAESFADFMKRLDYYELIAGADAANIAEVKQLRTALKAQRRTLAADRAAIAKDLVERRKKRRAIMSTLDKRQADYDRLQAELKRAMAFEKAAGKVTYRLPKGPMGMVFPEAGSCSFADTWGAPRGGGKRRHKGTDIMARTGTPCVAIMSGTVRIKSNRLGGKCIWLTGSNGWTFYYAHLNGYAVSSGTRVKAGQLIGYVGATGNASGGAPHLHFEIHPGGGGAVDPYPYLRAIR